MQSHKLRGPEYLSWGVKLCASVQLSAVRRSKNVPEGQKAFVDEGKWAELWRMDAIWTREARHILCLCATERCVGIEQGVCCGLFTQKEVQTPRAPVGFEAPSVWEEEGNLFLFNQIMQFKACDSLQMQILQKIKRTDLHLFLKLLPIEMCFEMLRGRKIQKSWFFKSMGDGDVGDGGENQASKTRVLLFSWGGNSKSRSRQESKSVTPWGSSLRACKRKWKKMCEKRYPGLTLVIWAATTIGTAAQDTKFLLAWCWVQLQKSD